MANADKPKPGRVTPKKNAVPPASSPRAKRPSITPRRIGPFSRPDSSAPLGQVGRRPTSAARLLVFAAAYFVCGVMSFFVLGGSPRIIVGVVMIGVSLLWLRGAATASLRQQRERSEE